MPRTLDADFITEKNKTQNRPIRLYAIEGGLLGGTVLRYAEYSEDVFYPTGYGTALLLEDGGKILLEAGGDLLMESGGGGFHYYAAPIRMEEVTENMAQQIDQVQVTLGAVDQAIIAYLEDYDGLRGCKVTIRTVFADLLSDIAAFTDDIFYIASVVLNQNAATFTLKSKLDVLRVEIPLRRFYRLTCQWKFKSTECGYVGVTATCNHDATSCIALNNLARFGGFPGTGSAIRRIYV